LLLLGHGCRHYLKKIIIAAGLNQSQSAVAGSDYSDYVIAFGGQENNRLGHGDCSRKAANEQIRNVAFLLSAFASAGDASTLRPALPHKNDRGKNQRFRFSAYGGLK
jgi:hypothetical protein